jgi:hypothetical protein
MGGEGRGGERGGKGREGKRREGKGKGRNEVDIPHSKSCKSKM